MDAERMTPNERIKEVRERMGLTQNELCAMIDMQQGSLSDIERGRAGVSSKVLSKLRAVGMNPHYIETGDGEPLIPTIATMRDRFLEAVDSLGYSSNLYGLTKRTGIEIKTLSEIMGGSTPDVETIEKLSVAFPSISRTWLLEDIGAMMKKETYLRDLEMAGREIDHLKETLKQKDEEIKFLRGLITSKS